MVAYSHTPFDELESLALNSEDMFFSATEKKRLSFVNQGVVFGRDVIFHEASHGIDKAPEEMEEKHYIEIDSNVVIDLSVPAKVRLMLRNLMKYPVHPQVIIMLTGSKTSVE